MQIQLVSCLTPFIWWIVFIKSTNKSKADVPVKSLTLLFSFSLTKEEHGRKRQILNCGKLSFRSFPQFQIFSPFILLLKKNRGAFSLRNVSCGKVDKKRKLIILYIVSLILRIPVDSRNSQPLYFNVRDLKCQHHRSRHRLHHPSKTIPLHHPSNHPLHLPSNYFQHHLTLNYPLRHQSIHPPHR